MSSRNHPIFVKGRGWLRADRIKPRHRLLTAKGDWATVVSTRIARKPLLAYNLNVAEHHNYFVGETGAWVHNSADEVERQIVRRFDSKQNIKKAKKEGIEYDPNVNKPGIPAASTNIDPADPHEIKDMFGARNADAYMVLPAFKIRQ